MRLFRNVRHWLLKLGSMRSLDAAVLRLKASIFLKLHHRALTTALLFGILLVPLSSSVNLSGQLGFLHRKIAVDTLEGGTIGEMLVVDGQFVKQGDVLARLLEPRLDAEITSLFNNAAARLCKLAKYEQLLTGAAFQIPKGYDLIPASHFTAYCGQEEMIAKGLLNNFKNRLSVIEKQISQVRLDLMVLETSLTDEKRRVEIQTHLYKKRQELVEQNFYAEAALLEQESQLITAKQGQAAKNLDLSDRRSRLLDLLRQKSDIESEFYDRYRTEAAGVRSEFESQYASLKASAWANKALTLTAPQSGYVNKLKKARTGLLLAPRETLLEIVPSTEEMVVLATYRPADHVNVFPGQKASVRLMTHNQSTAPEFHGQVISTSPDVRQDSPLDSPSYEAVIAFECDQACRSVNQLTAGVPVDVYVLGGKRSLLSYLMSSLYRFGSTALSEPN